MYPNSFFFGPKVPICRDCTWTLRVVLLAQGREASRQKKKKTDCEAPAPRKPEEILEPHTPTGSVKPRTL